ncbi:MAG: hypothetical protein H0U28_14790 [Nocardioidaceae bacterium]|nr:hypothetical protein [Nocardioidaceae bacterium]
MTSGQDRTTDFGTIVDWLECRLDADTAADVERIVLAREPDVLATVAWWRRFHAVASLPNEPVPEGLAHRLRAMGPAAPEVEGATGPSWLDHLLGVVRATVSFDSLRTPGLAMARSAIDETRQLVASGPGLDVAVDVSEPHGGELTAAAQLLPVDEHADPADVLVQAWARTGLVGEQRSDSLGRVELGALPADVVVLEVEGTSTWPPVHVELDLRQSV